MGLDNYLYRTRADNLANNLDGTVTPVDDDLLEQLYYWRGARFLHYYFTKRLHGKHLEGCYANGVYITVTRAELLELRGLCAMVQAMPHEAPTLLPVAHGEYCAADYDEAYIRKVRDVDECLAQVLALHMHADEVLVYCGDY